MAEPVGCPAPLGMLHGADGIGIDIGCQVAEHTELDWLAQTPTHVWSGEVDGEPLVIQWRRNPWIPEEER